MGRGRRTLLGGALLLAGAPLPTASFIASRRVASSTHAAVRLHISPPGTRTEEERIEATIEAGEAWNSDKKGGWTDSRGTWFPNRIQEVLTMDDIVATRVRHALFETEELARSVLQQLRRGEGVAEGNGGFEALAAAVSACEETKEQGGEIGWVGLNDEHLDHVLPREARVVALQQKPGDVVMAVSSRGVHLISVVDIMTKSKAQVLRSPSGGRRLAGAGDALPTVAQQLSGAPDTQPTYWMETMGCQMNAADSERIAGQLEDLGMRPVRNAKEQKEANVVILNTCSIRDHAEQKVYSHLGPHAIRKRKGEAVAIVVAGCVAQQEGEKLLRRVPEVDLVMGPQYSNRIGDLLEDVLNGNQVVATDPQHIMEDVTKPRRGSTVCAWVNVIYGCNEHCSYCVVPGTRGVEQSRPRDAIVKECAALASEGYREVTLLGQNIDAWGRDMEPKGRFADLLATVASQPKVDRVRFVTSHPRYMSPRVIDAVASNPSACPVFHIPFQSGDNEVLHNMRRGYTREKYLGIVANIRAAFPDGEVSVTGDVIVGFPGETEEQFRNTVALMEEVQFDACMTAAYSPRPNTPAALWENQVPDDVKQRRLEEVHALATEHALARSQRHLGKVEEVLVEMRNVKNPLQVMGRTYTNRQVFFEGDIDELKGKFVHVKVTEVRPFSLTGERVHDVEPY
jgi:tRNA-2-methylthio-N6-dimethylallyladenosine synthase